MKKLMFLTSLMLSQPVCAFPYKIVTDPPGASVKNVLTNEVIGLSPVVVDVANTEAGSTFGISYYRYENVAVRIVTVPPSAENGFAISGPAVVTMSLPGKTPLKVDNDENSATVTIQLKPYMSEPVRVAATNDNF
ncbi:hypothetical protein [Photorhabdus heterorhabditis]|uniref:hypothetical protein n=1 Tax=Photorhabdus heterorhabditis TaxID=880156 RepID=UPI001562E8CD|nr:hypothetical protein [Photorhabdus heterorhabditis]NRN29005.1 hypothetical protein [Photorhabdus heterorhabditis subsp. aluminescens]